MQPLPASALRRNVGTWCVPTSLLPAVSHFLHDALPNEPYDPHFLGQRLETTYFDTAAFDLRRARQAKGRYLTLRLRCYAAPGQPHQYALSAKTEAEKWRREVAPADAEAVLARPQAVVPFLPGRLLARLQELAGGDLLCAVTVCCRRYAVEDALDRYTLDVGVTTDRGKRLGFAVLEHKSVDGGPPPAALAAVGLRRMKLSKFLWALEV
jgi:hypothetical protein